MAYLATMLAGWLIGAFLIGFGTGWIAVVWRGRVLTRTWAQRLGALIVILFGLAIWRVVPGRFGYGLDLALTMFVVYLVGCVIGSWLREILVSRQARAR